MTSQVLIQRDDFDLSDEKIIRSPYYHLEAHLMSQTLEAFVYSVAGDSSAYWGVYSLEEDRKAMAIGGAGKRHDSDPVEFAIEHCLNFMKRKEDPLGDFWEKK